MRKEPDFKATLAASEPVGESFKVTRSGEQAPFWDTVSNGAAPSKDGLYMLPDYDRDFFAKEVRPFLEAKKPLSPAQIGALILRKFIGRGDIADDALSEMMATALNFDMPLEKIGDATFVLRLDRGPTASFKDVAARTLAGLMEKYCEAHNAPLNLIVATSGDTGVAVADAFGNKKNITVTVLYPNKGVSEVQEKQMLDVERRFSNVQVLAVEGVFDDAQTVSKILQSVRGIDAMDFGPRDIAINNIIGEIKLKLGGVMDTSNVNEEYVQRLVELVDPLNLSSANSINLWRLIPQMTQFFVAYEQAVRLGSVKAGEKVVFSVPSGNAGHLTAGLFARKMGLPVKRFVVGTNANNILANMIGDGEIRMGGFEHTSAPSMDIEGPNNFERILGLFAEEIGYKGPIDFVGMANDMRNMSDQMKFQRKKLREAEKAGDSLRVDDLQSMLVYDLGTKGIDLTKYGDEEAMLMILSKMQEVIWAEDVETDDELHAAMMLAHHQHGSVLEPHGIAALIATTRARRKGVVSASDKVIVLETAHPDKFPDALQAAGVKDKPHQVHPVLEGLKDFDRGTPVSHKIDLMEIARRVRVLANKMAKPSV